MSVLKASMFEGWGLGLILTWPINGRVGWLLKGNYNCNTQSRPLFSQLSPIVNHQSTRRRYRWSLDQSFSVFLKILFLATAASRLLMRKVDTKRWCLRVTVVAFVSCLSHLAIQTIQTLFPWVTFIDKGNWNFCFLIFSNRNYSQIHFHKRLPPVDYYMAVV